MESLKILIAEDDFIAQCLYKKVLEQQYELHLASNGQEALDFARNNKYALIILDVRMPKLSGLDVIKIIKSEKINHEAHVIFISGFSQAEYEKMGYALGAVDFINKPIKPNELEWKVRSLMRDYVSRIELREKKLHQEQEKRIKYFDRLSGAIIHDFNNILTSALGFIDLTERSSLLETDYKPEARSFLAEAKTSLRKMEKINKLIQATSKIKLTPEKTCINDLIIIASTDLLFYQDAVKCQLFLDVWMVNVDKKFLEGILRSFFNLIYFENENDGCIVISTDNVYIDKSDINFVPNSVSGNFVRLEIKKKINNNQEFVCDNDFLSIKNFENRGISVSMVVLSEVFRRMGGWMNFRELANNYLDYEIFLPAVQEIYDQNNLNCWEFKQCGRELGGIRVYEYGVCPAAINAKSNGIFKGKNAGRVCWTIEGTLCTGAFNSTISEKIEHCERCKFFQKVKSEEGISDIRDTI